MTSRPPRWPVLLGLGVGLLVIVLLARGVRSLATTRGAVQTFARMITAANAGDLATVRSLCSASYRTAHPPELARGGGVIGFPRQIHPNFQVWVQGSEVWLCSSNRVGTVYRFIREEGRWQFAGPVGFLRSDGSLVALPGDQGQPGKIP